MLKHYLIVIYRSFIHFKSSLLINLMGLSTGLACVLFIYLWVNDELNFDKFHKNDERLYQVMAKHNNAETVITVEGTPDILAETLAEELPEVEYASAVFPGHFLGEFVLSTGEKKIKAVGQFAGKDYFKIFSFNLIQGNRERALPDENSAVISKQMALNLFGSTENIIGKVFEWQLLNITERAVVSGIFSGAPKNSSAQFEFALSFEAWKNFSNKMNRPINWDNHGPSAFLLLKKGTNIADFNKKIEGFIKTKYERSNVTLFTRKFSDGYLYGKYENGVQSGGRIEYVKVFSVIAIFILVIACINFMNLSTAKAKTRFKEVGIKKTLGADRRNLILQYMGESTAMAFLSLLIAFIVVELLLPRFNEITGKSLTLKPDADLVLFFIIITLITGILSGSYPALYLSRFNPAIILKSKSVKSPGEHLARRGLVVFQFTLSVILIVSVLIVYKQVEYLQTKNPGFEKNNIIYFNKEGKAAENPETFLAEIKKIPGVVNAAISGSTMIGSQNSTGGVGWEGKNPEDIIYFEEIYVGYDMLATLGIELKEGRAFSKEFGAENSKIIFNEAAISVMGLKNPVGTKVFHYSGEKEIIGVAKDFHFESLHENVKPALFRIAPEYTKIFMVKIEAGKEKETINKLEKLYKGFNAGYSFDFKFLDEDYQSQYDSEKRIEILSGYFAGLAVIISCLGLFGLAAFTAEQRRKEIGIRKVLGADTKGLILLLSKEFLILVLISLLAAYPVAWYIANNWLQDFAYRIEISIWIFVIAGSIALLIALVTVSVQALKAATANPVESLKYE